MLKLPPLELDAHHRHRALALDSFIVEAPAGAGKTELLTQRYLRLLQTVNAPEEIIAITFTNKAAAEMRLRILNSLRNAAQGNEPDAPHQRHTYQLSQAALQHAQKLNWQLIENPASLRIFTIDSLCGHLARQMPLLSRFGAQPKVTEDASALYAAAAEATLALIDEAGAHGEVLKTTLRYMENNASALSALLVSMLEKREQWLGYTLDQAPAQDAARFNAILHTLVAQGLSPLAHAVPEGLQTQLMPIARFAAAHLPCDKPVALLVDWDSPISTAPDTLPLWRALADFVLNNEGEVRKIGGLNVNYGFPKGPEGKAFKEQFAEVTAQINDMAALHRVRVLPDLTQNQANWQMVAAFSALLNLAVAQLWLQFQAAGEVDFSEVAQRATQALGDAEGTPTELALRLDYQIKHVLVDEFQDTSPSQIKLLAALTQGWQAGDGRTLFAVGDPMQSIYRFRKADVGLFIAAATQGIGDVSLENLRLYRNNRACPAVVDWVNQTFATIFPSADDMQQGAICHRPSIATKAPHVSSGVFVHPIIKCPDETKDALNKREAEAALAVILKTRQASPEQKIAVLVRAKRHLTPLVTLLRRLHPEIAFQAVEIEALAGRQVVQDLCALTHALHHRADRVHWLALLRAPWCGLNLHDLHALAGHDHHSTIWQLMQQEHTVQTLSADGQQRLNHVRAVLQEAFLSQGRMSISRWVRGVWLMLNGASCLWAAGDIADVHAFFACVNQLDQNNAFTLERLQTELGKLFAAPDGAGEHLQMMTVHKSKGLEFDTVILLGLGEASGGHDSPPLLRWEKVMVNQHPTLLAAPYLPKGVRNKAQVSVHDYLTTLEKERDLNETARVLYVAATRAERQLHLIGAANCSEKDGVKPAANSPLSQLWPALAPIYLAANEAMPTEPERATPPDNAPFSPQLLRLEKMQIPPVFLTEKAHFAHNSTAQTQTKTAQNQQHTPSPPTAEILASHIGTLTHHYLEIIATQGLAAWSPTRVASMRPAMQTWLAQQGHALETASQGAQNVVQLLSATLNSAHGQWVLQAHPQAQAELARYTLENNTPKKYVIDRTFVSDGVRWIVDYKTTPLAESSTEAQLKEMAEQHRPQLENYAKLFADAPLPIQKSVLFLSVGRLVLLER